MQGFGTGRRRRDADEIASVYGDTPEGLASFEGRTVADRAPMASFAEGAFAKPETLEARLEKARTAFADATTPEDKAAAEAVAKSIQVAMDVGQDPKDLKAYADKLSIQVMNASTPADKQAALNKLNRVNAQIKSNGAAQAQEKDRADEEGKKALTFPQLRSSVDRAVGSAIGQIAGSDKLAIKLEDGTTGYRKPRKGDLPELVTKAREATISFLNTNGYLNEDGSPKTAFAKAILSADGYYGDTAPPQGGLPTPTTQEEYDAIPSGTRYTDTDGKVKTKS